MFTGGTGNAVISTLELAGSVITSLLAIILPIIGFILVVILAVYLLLKAGRIFFRKMKTGNRNSAIKTILLHVRRRLKMNKMNTKMFPIGFFVICLLIICPGFLRDRHHKDR